MPFLGVGRVCTSVGILHEFDPDLILELNQLLSCQLSLSTNYSIKFWTQLFFFQSPKWPIITFLENEAQGITNIENSWKWAKHPSSALIIVSLIKGWAPQKPLFMALASRPPILLFTCLLEWSKRKMNQWRDTEF
jgi:hypothetical protein